jgi:hypothetical protein
VAATSAQKMRQSKELERLSDSFQSEGRSKLMSRLSLSRHEPAQRRDRPMPR